MRRSIEKEREFEEQLIALLVNDEHADDYVAAAEDVLSRDPKIGAVAAVGPPQIWMLALPPIRGRAAALFYTFTEDVVILLWIVAYD